MQPGRLFPGFFFTMDKKTLEKYSSAFTLSDMEIFIFPELLYALVLANIISPEIWKWRDDPWFSGIRKMGPLKKIHRLKQFIMDHYGFNLDLETWGLTDKQTEINRFSDFVDIEMLSRSNALFGYEGDKYYFDMDIRQHFGLDKYDTEIIPYWKTETLEAMNAFRFKEGHEIGAGECVSLACLYAAALFIVAEVPLEKIFLMGTPLHSQNFILIDEGVLTNNRRIVTKSMWFNGTELSALARRALEHEQVTIVAHSSGYIHSFYPEATISPDALHLFRDKLNKYLETHLDFEVFMNFLRDYSRYQKYFQICFFCQGSNKYIRLEKAFGYEHGSKNRLSDKTSRKLFCEMDEEDLSKNLLDCRLLLLPNDDLFLKKTLSEFIFLIKQKYPELEKHEDFFLDLKKFVHTVPRLPSENKTYIKAGEMVNSQVGGLNISVTNTREEIIQHLSSLRQLAVNSDPESPPVRQAGRILHPASVVADLAFYAGRYMDSCNWEPFLKAAFERNPVTLDRFKELDVPSVFHLLQDWPNESIYDGNRLALPDEVVNFQRGDGLEKALTLMNVAKSRHVAISVSQTGKIIQLQSGNEKFSFTTAKSLIIPLI